MSPRRPLAPYVRDAAMLLGEQVRLARRERGWTQHELAERAGIATPTLRKVERGDLGVAIGTAFEVAAIVGVPLFHADPEMLRLDLDRTQARSALLPNRIVRGAVDDDF